MELVQSLLCGAVGAALVAGLFSLLGKKVDHSHEDRKEKMTESKGTMRVIAPRQEREWQV